MGTQVILANGHACWALIGNIDLDNQKLTKHFLTLSLECDGRWFHLARYHDHDYNERGPAALAEFLRLDVNSVFPIRYDVSAVVRGDREAATGSVLAEPDERLTRAEVIALAVP